MRKIDEHPQQQTTPFSRIAARLYWLTFGNLFLIVAAFSAGKRAFPSWADGVFALVALSLVAVRWLDIARFGGLTAEGRPATRRDFVQYTLLLVPAAALLWGAGRLLGGR